MGLHAPTHILALGLAPFQNTHWYSEKPTTNAYLPIHYCLITHQQLKPEIRQTGTESLRPCNLLPLVFSSSAPDSTNALLLPDLMEVILEVETFQTVKH